jgi:hypothetical protein
VRILTRRIKRKIEDVLGEDCFGFKRGEGNRNAIDMMKKYQDEFWRQMKNCMHAV